MEHSFETYPFMANASLLGFECECHFGDHFTVPSFCRNQSIAQVDMFYVTFAVYYREGGRIEVEHLTIDDLTSTSPFCVSSLEKKCDNGTLDLRLQHLLFFTSLFYDFFSCFFSIFYSNFDCSQPKGFLPLTPRCGFRLTECTIWFKLRVHCSSISRPWN